MHIVAKTARFFSVRQHLGLVAGVCVSALLCGCAPVQTGNDQSKDVNVNLVALKDAKYQTLPESAGGLSSAMRAAIDQKVQDWMASKPVPIAGCAIAITRNNQIAYLKAYGKADAAANRPFTIATPCAIGSISKTLTALGLMTLVEDGKLDLDEPLLDQMGLTPGVDVGWTYNATLREVLAHKGGFTLWPVWNPSAFDDGPSMAAAFPNIPFPSLQPLLVFQGYKSMAANQTEPGDPSYSNMGYSLAGALLDYRTKQNDIPAYMRGYESYIWHRVGRGGQSSEPTMITACLATDFRTSDIKNLAKGYAQDGSDLNFGDLNWVGWGWEGPSGGWAMTIGDLGRLMLILQSDAVISKSLIDDEMRKNHGPLSVGGNLWEGVRAGLGLELAAPGGDVWFGKGGDILGYTADMRIWPSPAWDVTWGVAFVCNQEKTGKALTSQLYNLLAAGVPSGRAPEEAPRDSIAKLVEQYEPFVHRFAEQYLARAKTSENAWLQAKRDLAAYPNGKVLAEMLERGELEQALQQLPGIAPILNILHRGNSLMLTWPNAATGFRLQQTPDIAKPKWTDVPDAPVVVGDEKHVTAPRKAGEQFYRLHKR